MESTWLVAAEHDEEAFERLEKALRELGYELTSKKWGAADRKNSQSGSSRAPAARCKFPQRPASGLQSAVELNLSVICRVDTVS